MVDSKASRATYSIGAVSRLTGLTTHALRMWEHRYQAVTPVRTDSGRRTYTAADVEKLSMLKALTDRGSPISSIAGLPHKALRTRLEQDRALSRVPGAGTIAVAAMGATIPALLRKALKGSEEIHLLAAGTEPRGLDADIAGQPVDALLMEFPVLDRHTISVVRELRKQYRQPPTIVIYRFGRSTDQSSLTKEGVVTLRLPVTGTELAAAISAQAAIAPKTRTPKTGGNKKSPQRTTFSPVPARRFDGDQLARLNNIKSSVECECPQHLAEILSSLTAFEVYSSDCEETDSEQAELHAYLHNATGQARGIMEAALSHLVEIENISV